MEGLREITKECQARIAHLWAKISTQDLLYVKQEW
jgi:hypothetical protein